MEWQFGGTKITVAEEEYSIFRDHEYVTPSIELRIVQIILTVAGCLPRSTNKRHLNTLVRHVISVSGVVGHL